jgi:hypothetical protein
VTEDTLRSIQLAKTGPHRFEAANARAVLHEAIAMSRDRMCTACRSVELGADVVYPQANVS